MRRFTFTLSGTDGLDALASEIIKCIEPIKCIAFYGEMGSGKTTLIKAICRVLGVTENTSSPTFAIVHTYLGKAPVYHFDLFRLRSQEELHAIGFAEYLDAGNYVFIEWPDLAANYLAEFPHAVCRIETDAAGIRQFTIETPDGD